MDKAILLARRDAVIERHKTLESVQGSGWHKDDTEQRAMRDKGFGCVSDRPVAIQVDDRVYFVGADVSVVRETLKKFIDREAALASAAADAGETRELANVNIQAERISKRVCSSPDDVIELPPNEFNAIMYAFTELGVLCVVTGLK